MGVPARFAYTALDGDPQVMPIGVGRPWRIVDSTQAGDPDQRTKSVLQTPSADAGCISRYSRSSVEAKERHAFVEACDNHSIPPS